STSAKAANQGVGVDFRSLAQPNDIRHSPGAQSQIIAHENTTASTKAQPITYQDQHRVWATGAPVLLLFGTAHGLSPALVAQSDFLLAPVAGFSDFNHLSVRSAAAIVLDRWLGLQPREAAAGPL
ncbi:MAG TPA: RNA methyltransferase, partial [Candidatus Babeliales bacterium]|nr:RNA methyltransferase [Candidatus Babeliales bacterium]